MSPNDKLWCPECGVRVMRRGLTSHLALKHEIDHGGGAMTTQKRLRRARTIDRAITKLPDDDALALGVMTAIGERGLRPTLRRLFRGEFFLERGRAAASVNPTEES